MPWSVAKRGDSWCVVKEGETEPIKGGCHASRSDALRHQRALYANESSTASANGPLRIELGGVPDETLPVLVASLTAISDRLAETEGALALVMEKLALLASAEPPVVNVSVPEPVVNITVPEPVVNVNVPEARVEITTPTPVVNVELPPVRKTVTFERDALSGSVTGAVVEEDFSG